MTMRRILQFGLLFAALCLPGRAQTPGFVSESGQNSTLLISASASTGTGGIIPGSTCASYSYCIPFAETSLSGNLGIDVYEYANGGTPVSATATDDKSDTWTCTNPSATDSNKLLGLCYSASLPGTTSTNGAHLVATTFGTTAVTQVQADEAMFYNVATSSPVDAGPTDVSGASSTTMTGPTLTVTVGDLVYAYFCRTGTPVMTSGVFTLGSGFSAGLFKYQDGCASEWQVATSTSVTPTMTMGSASTYLVIAVAFKAASAGTAPTAPYLKRFSGWSVCGGGTLCQGTTSASTWLFQFPNDSGDSLVMTEAGATNYAANSITDSGSNVWTLAGQCLQTGSCVDSGGYSSEFYSIKAGANTTNTQTVNFTGTGDATINFYEFVGIDAFDQRGQFAEAATTTTHLPNAAFSFVPYTTSVLYVATGPIAFNTGVSVSSPSGNSNYFDGGFFGGESVNRGGSPATIIGQNNIWSHSYATGITAAQSWQWNTSQSTSEANDTGVDLLSFLTNVAAGTGVGIVNQANAQATSGTDLQVTVPSTTAGNLLAISTGVYDGSTLRTVSKVCTGTSTTCATGTQFTQAASATNAGVASALLATDVWYLLSAPSGVTTVTVVYSGAVTFSEVMYYEVENGNVAGWTADGANKVHDGASCTTTCSGGAITPTGNPDFCIAHLSTSGTGVTANPKSGNAWLYTGHIFTISGDAATALLTTSSSAQTPQWTAAAGTINSSDACFKAPTTVAHTFNFADYLNIVDFPASQGAHFRKPAETVAARDSSGGQGVHLAVYGDTASASDTPAGSAGHPRTVAEALALLESGTGHGAHGAITVDLQQFLDAQAGHGVHSGASSEALIILDAGTKSHNSLMAVLESIGLQESPSGHGVHGAAAKDAFLLADLGAGMHGAFAGVLDAVGLHELSASFGAHLAQPAENLHVLDSGTGRGAHFESSKEVLVIFDLGSKGAMHAVSVSDLLSVGDLSSRMAALHLGTSDVVALSDFGTRLAGLHASSSDQFIIFDLGSKSNSHSVIVMDIVGFGDSAARLAQIHTAPVDSVMTADLNRGMAAHYGSVAEAVSFRDMPGRGRLADISELLNLMTSAAGSAAHFALAGESFQSFDLNSRFANHFLSTIESLRLFDFGIGSAGTNAPPLILPGHLGIYYAFPKVGVYQIFIKLLPVTQ